MLYEIKNLKFKDILDINQMSIVHQKVTCILGESGGGKTTLLKLFNKMISPTEGMVTYEGQDLQEMNSVVLRKKVLMLNQKPFIFKGTIKDNLEFGLKLHHMKLSDEELLKQLETVHLHKTLDFDASKLSGGEAQRLALVRLLILNPDVVLLDEPSSALDEETEKLVIEHITTFVRSSKKTLIMVTHSKDIAMKYADHIIYMDKGKIKEVQS